MLKVYPGGYVMVDAGGLDIQLFTEDQEIPGLYESLEAAYKTNKPVMLTNLHSGEGVYTSPVYGELLKNGDDFTVKANSISALVEPDDSVRVSDLIPAAVTAPAAFTEAPVATIVDGNPTITWPAADRAQWYIVARARSTSPTSFSQLTTDYGSTTFVDTSTLVSGGEYLYRVRAYNLFGSNEARNSNYVTIP
jgi:hypothetical protein